MGYRAYNLEAQMLHDARMYFLSVVGVSSIKGFMKVVTEFRMKRGFFGMNEFDTHRLNDEDIMNLDVLLPWQSLQFINDPVVSKVVETAIALLSYVCHQASIEKMFKGYRTVSSHRQQRKGPKRKDQELYIKYNSRQFAKYAV